MQESGNDVGGSSSATGNTITYGVSNTAFDMTYNLASTTVSIPCGVAFRNGAGNNIRFNTITNVSTLTQSNAGIFCTASTAPVGITYTNNYSDNNITINITASVAVTGIDFGSGIATGTITCSNNIVTINHTVSATNSATDYGIKANFTSASSNINNNTVTLNESVISSAASITNSGALYGIYLPGGTTGTPTVNSLGNTLNIIKVSLAASGYTSTFSGTTYGMYTSTATSTFNLGSSGNGNNIYINDSLSSSPSYTGTGTFSYTLYGYYLAIAHANLYANYNTVTTGRSGKIRTTGTVYVFYHSISFTSGLSLSNNTISLDRGLATTGTLYGFYSCSATGVLANGYTISGNNITYTAPSAGGTFYGIYSCDGGTPTKSYNNNTFTVGGSALSVYGIYVGYGNITITGNSFNLSSAIATTPIIYGIYGTGAGTAFYDIYNNTFTSLLVTGAGTSAPTVAAIYISTIANTTLASKIHDNIISNIATGAGSGNAIISGIHIAGGAASTTLNVYRNKIYDLSTSNTGATTNISLIRVSGGITNNIYNNLLSQTNSLTGVTNPNAVIGLNVTSSTASSATNFYYNTLYLASTSTGANFGATGIFHTSNATATTASLSLRNNIIVNNVTPTGTGTSYAYRRSSTALNNFSSSSNNNLFFCSTGIFNDGTNTDLTIGDYKTRVNPREGNSVNEPLTWLNINNPTGANFMQLNPSTPTQVESGAVAIAGFNDDYNTNGSRASFPLSGQTYGGGSAPDLGAQEMDLPPADLSGPSISYTPIASTTNTSAVTLTATISDASGVATSGIGLPVLYWRTGNTGSYAAVSATWVSGSTYTFTFGGGVVNDQIQYYIAAQDNAATPNVSISPSAGSNGNSINPPACSTPPTTPSRYTILSTWNGTYVIGGNGAGPASGADYVSLGEALADVTPGQIKSVYLSNGGSGYATAPTITFTGGGGSGAAATAYVSGGVITRILITSTGSNYSSAPTVVITSTTGTGALATANVSAGKVMSGPVTFSLSSNYDGTLYEGVFPITISDIGQTASNTLTIKPATGVSATISGTSANAIFDLNGADYTTIDGSNSGNNSKNLTIINYSTTAGAAVIEMTSLGQGLGATNNTIKNCNIANGSTAVITYGISISGLTAGTTGADNDNNTIQSNNITSVTTGIYAIGTTKDTVGGLNNLNIIGNNISFTSSITGAYGIRAGFALNSTVNQNTIDIETSNSFLAGISLETGFVSSIVNRNRIVKVRSTSTTLSPIARGIVIGTGQTSSNVTISNNVIYNVISSYGTSTVVYNNAGIFIGSIGVSTVASTTTGGINVYHNSVNLYGNMDRTLACLQYSLFIGSAASNLDIRNNIFSNSIFNTNATGTASKSYAIYCQSANTAFSNINFNDYFVSGTQGVLGFLTSDRTNLAGIQTGFGGNVNSLNVDPAFNNNSVLLPQVGAPILGVGTPISGLTTDFLGATRSLTAPSMGAYENGGDGASPIITYTNLTNAQASASRTLVATITDAGTGATGVDTTVFVPTIYFKKSTDGNSFVGNTSADNGWKRSASTSTNSPFSLTMDFSLLRSPLAQGDVIQYFVVAQDYAGNLGASPSLAFDGSNVNTIINAPILPSSYTVLGPPIAAGTYTIGTTVASTYPTITAAALDFSLRGIAGAVTYELVDPAYNSTTGETFPIVFGNTLGTSASNTITIRPIAGNNGVVVSSTDATATFDLNGSQFLTLDGRPGGTGSFVSGTSLIINNVGTTAPAIRLVNEARNNNILYCDLQANNTTATTATAGGGVVCIGGTTGANGNDNNTISFCDIHNATGGNPLIGVYGYGSATSVAANNDSNYVTNCNIYDFFSAASATAGIYVGVNNGYWRINNNRFYQTAARTLTGAVVHRAIWCTPNTGSLTSASGFTINNNFIGGNSSAGTGMYTSTSAVASSFLGIDASVGHGAYTEIQNNTITNINQTSANTNSATLVGIKVANGNVNIGTTTGNTIGSTTANSAIILNTSVAGGGFIGIQTTAGPNINISNNRISGIEMTGTTSTAACEFFGLALSGGNNLSVTNNVIGDATLTNSINSSSTAATSTFAQRIHGIIVNPLSGTPVYNISNNTVANINTNYSATGTQAACVIGINMAAAFAGTYNITNNTVRNLSSATQTTGTGAGAAITGISVNTVTTNSNATVTGNTVHTLIETGATANSVNGIFFSGATTGTYAFSRNFVHSIKVNGIGSSIRGFAAAAGSSNINNNMIRIGIDETGADMTTSALIHGMSMSGGTHNVYYNTVLINGSNVATGTDSTYAIRSTIASGTNNYRNNIFANTRQNGGSTGKHYAMAFAGATTLPSGLTLNNNNYFTTSAPLALYNGIDRNDLGAWKTALGLDANSMVEAPAFVSATGTNSTVNLHIVAGTQSLMESGGAAISSLTTDFDGDARPGPAGSVNGGGLSSDIGADEFDGSMFPIDMGVQVLVSPVGSCAISGKTVTVRIKNFSLTQTINFATNPVTINGSVSGPNPTSFAAITLNSDTLTVGGTKDIIITSNYDMSNVGTYTFDANTNVTGDANTSNDAMPSANVIITGLTAGTVTANESSFCKLTGPPILNTTATGGDIQWMYSTASNAGPWTNVGTNSTSYTHSSLITTSTYFMATVSCNSSSISAGDTVGVIVPVINSTTHATRCGTGTVNLVVTGGVGNVFNWYTASTGGAPIYSGSTFTTPTISATTNYYVAASSNGSFSSSIGLANRVGATQNTGYVDVGLMFDAFTPFTLTSVNMYPVNSTPGTASLTIQLKNSAGTVLQTTTVSVATTVAPGVKTLIPLNFSVPAGTGHRLVIQAATGLTGLTREVTTGYTYPYTVSGVASITSAYTAGASAAYYYYFYDWLIGTGCESARQMVTATVNTAPSLAISSPITNICTGQTNTSTINITSNVNDFDTYTWTPNTNISGNTASGFVFSPSVPTVYTLNASQSTGQQCVNSTSLSVTLTPLAAGTTSSSITKLCNTNGVPTLSTSATGANSYQWYSSTTSKNGPFTAVGTNSNTYTPSSNVTSTTFYMATVSCNSAPIAAGDTVEVHVPVLLTSAGGSRCGAGTVNLTASGALNDSINWYASATAVTPLYTGTTYSPSVSATTNYYVAAVAPGFSVPTNAALTATSAHSGGGATTYGATNYNDGIISAYNSLPWGWVTQGGWIEYTWNTPQNLTKVIFYKDNRPFTSMTIEYWNGSAYVPYQTGYAGTTSPVDSIIFPYVITTTKIRFNAINSTPANPNFREIEVYAGSSCESARAMVTATVNPIPSAPSVPATVSKTGSSIDVTWNSVSGATAYQLDVATDAGFTSMVSGYNNLSVSGNSKSITGLVGGTSYFIRVRAINSTSCASANSSTLNETTPASNVNVALTAFLQGMYVGSSAMTAAPFNADGVTSNTIADTITVELRTASGNLAYSSVGTINTSGVANITFPGAAIGSSYYITIKHRNSVATATADTITILANGTSYNFSNAITKAFGDNMVDDGNGVFMIFTGDINQDGSVDFNDYPSLDISSSNGDLGYLPFDLNGDASVDFNDYPVIDVNSSNGIISILPY